MSFQHHSAAKGFLSIGAKLALKASIRGFVLISDVTSQIGRGGEGVLTFVTGELLQLLHNKKAVILY